jgi:large subunit ribosomal protein L15
MLTLKQAGLVGELAKVVKVIKTGAMTKAVKLNGHWCDRRCQGRH